MPERSNVWKREKIMIIKCPNCNGALEYNVETGKLYCGFCGSFFRPEEIDMPQMHPDTTGGTTGTVPRSNPVNPYDFQNTSGIVKNPFQRFDSVGNLEKAAADARENGMSGSITYDYSRADGDSIRESYYEEQQRLHEEYLKRPKVDYSKPFAGTSRENMTDYERQMAAEEDKIRFERDRAEIRNLYTIDAMGRGAALTSTGPNSGDPMNLSGSIAEMVQGTSIFEASTGVDPDTAAKIAEKKMEANLGKNPRYTPAGHRILCDSNMYVTTEAPPEEGKFTMDNNIYTCTTCGAELSITGVETSSFCAYCGQPTIVFSRMEKTTMPDHIIPFAVTKDQALKAIREKLQKGILVPSEIKNFEVERLRGIFIPYWLFDAHYQDSMVIKTRIKSGKTTVTRYYRLNSECDIYYYPVDASKRLNDNLSRKLEPYDYSGIRPFNPAYMSGFYADRFDMDADTMTMNSMYRVQGLVYEKACKKTPGSASGLVEAYPFYHVKKQYYTLLPAWFMTFRYEGIPYTILVNGQNEKVVGAVPFSQKKFWGLFAGLFAGFSAVAVPLGMKLVPDLLLSGGKNDTKLFFVMLFFIVGMYFIGMGNISRYKKSMELSSGETITKFVRERQDI